MEVTRRTGTSKTSVWRWQERFLDEGCATRPARRGFHRLESRSKPCGRRHANRRARRSGYLFSSKRPHSQRLTRFGVATCRRLQQNPSGGLLDRRGIATKPGLADVTPFTGIERRPTVHGDTVVPDHQVVDAQAWE
jgi:hypothetical protein